MKRTFFASLALGLVVAACNGVAEPGAEVPTTGSLATPTTAAISTDGSTVPERSFAGTQPAPEFPSGLDWINTSDAVALGDLLGKVVVLDFWTYGCINCIHVIPDLKRLEAEFANELVVIGVHSAKFLNEGATSNIRNIVVRYGVDHPVVNDHEFAVWRTWGANAWPTTAVIDPAGNVVGVHSGEGVYDVLQPVISSLINEFESTGVLDRTPIEFAPESANRAQTILSFPGKVFVDPTGATLYVADSGHNRIVAVDTTSGEVLQVYGRGEPGFTDGEALEARFDSPQGMALSPDGRILYVADTNNHAVRSIELATGDVATAAGTGRLGWPPTGGLATEVSLNSPWDLAERNGKLYIAMAGHHQIWVMDLASDIAQPLVGNARESTSNGPLALAELAQPSGLAFDGDGVLYFADAESSAIRSAQVELADGVTDIVVGSDANLFDFGDVDGVGTEARLQHPLGLALAADGYLYVADTYNSKLKRVDLDRREIETYLGGSQGWQDGETALFYEPGGLATYGELLYIADTNNHVVRIVNLTNDTTETLILKGIEKFNPPPDNSNYRGEIIEVTGLSAAPGAGTIELRIELPAEYKVNDDAPSSAAFFVTGAIADFSSNAELSLTGAKFPISVPVEFAAGSGSVTADLTVIYCREDSQGLCLIQQLRFILDVVVTDGAPDAIALEYTIEVPNI